MISEGAQTTTYIQNVLIKAFASEGQIERAREIFGLMQDPPMGKLLHSFPTEATIFDSEANSFLRLWVAVGLAAPSSSSENTTDNSPAGVVYRQPSTYEAMVRAEVGYGERQRAVELCDQMETRLCTSVFF